MTSVSTLLVFLVQLAHSPVLAPSTLVRNMRVLPVLTQLRPRHPPAHLAQLERTVSLDAARLVQVAQQDLSTVILLLALLVMLVRPDRTHQVVLSAFARVVALVAAMLMAIPPLRASTALVVSMLKQIQSDSVLRLPASLEPSLTTKMLLRLAVLALAAHSNLCLDRLPARVLAHARFRLYTKL
jgi:hypothetical protein